MEKNRVRHPFEPVYDAKSNILILGSFPSVASRDQDFYYGHKQNRFWKMLAAIYDDFVPTTILEKKQLLLTHHLALWDVILECEVQGSSDASITHAVPTDIANMIAESNIQKIVINGNKAYQIFKKYHKQDITIPVIPLPSTSPANAKFTLELLCSIWKEALMGTDTIIEK